MVADPYYTNDVTDFEINNVGSQRKYCISDLKGIGCGRIMLLLSYQINRSGKPRQRVRWGYFCPDCDRHYRVYENE